MIKKTLYINNKFRLGVFGFTTGGFISDRQNILNIVISDIKTNNIESMRTLRDFKFSIANYEYEYRLVNFCIKSELFIVSQVEHLTVFECNNNLKLQLL